MAKVVPASGAPEAFGDVRRNGDGRTSELRRESVPFDVRELARYSISFHDELHTGLPRDQIAVRLMRRAVFAAGGHKRL